MGQVVVSPRGVHGHGAAPALRAEVLKQSQTATRCFRRGQASGVVLAGEQTKTQGRIGQQGHAQAVAGLVGAVLKTAVNQGVGVLNRGHSGQSVLLGQANKLVHTEGRFVGQTDRTHLARLHQTGQGLELFVDAGARLVLARIKAQLSKSGHVARGPMQLVEVDDIGLQPAQTALTRRDDLGSAQARVVAADPRHTA